MRIWSKKHALSQLGIAIILTLSIGTAVGSRSGWGWSLLISLCAGFVYYYLAMIRYWRRLKLVQTPFPEAWRAQLEECIPFYQRLDEDGRIRFENDIRIFLSEQRIYGLRGNPLDDEIKVFIAASAAILGHGLPDWEWPNLRDIIVYPSAFDDEYEIDDDYYMAGMVHEQGPIIYSERDLKHGFCRKQHGSNVGIHELAHVMDMADGEANGIPAGMTWIAAAPWIKVIADRIQKVRKGRCQKILREYAGVNEAEFFAVAVEVFFEQPEHLRRMDRELYDLMATYFNIHPENPSGKAPGVS